MEDNIRRANTLVQEAEKILDKPDSFLGGLLGKQPKQYDALQCYGQACVLFKSESKWMDAGNTFVKMAQLHEGLANKDDCATNYVNAANCFKESNPREAVNTFVKAINVYVAMKRFSIAAKHHQIVAEIYENRISDRNKAQTHYQKAVDYFKGDESSASAKKCAQKVYEYKAKLQNTIRAKKVVSQLTDEEVEFVKECFNNADIDGDGQLSAEEVKTCFKDIDGEMIDYYVRLSDINMNGTVELEEAMEMYALLSYKAKPSKELIRQMFLGLDKNKDGTISAYELSIFCKLFKPKETESTGLSYSELLKKLDDNQDGKIDYNEFVNNYSHLL